MRFVSKETLAAWYTLWDLFPVVHLLLDQMIIVEDLYDEDFVRNIYEIIFEKADEIDSIWKSHDLTDAEISDIEDEINDLVEHDGVSILIDFVQRHSDFEWDERMRMNRRQVELESRDFE
jgi:hypothetical protein